MYEQIITRLNREEQHLDRSLIQHQRERYSAEQLENLRQEYPGIPEEYLAYLSEIGEGGILDELFTIFGEPVAPEELLDESLHEFLDEETKLLQFGTTHAGIALVFLPEEGWEVGFLYHDDLAEVERTEMTFREFIHDRVLELYPDSGSDDVID